MNFEIYFQRKGGKSLGGLLPAWRGPRGTLETLYVTGCCLVVELTRPGVPEDPERAFNGLLRLPGKLPRGKGKR